MVKTTSCTFLAHLLDSLKGWGESGGGAGGMVGGGERSRRGEGEEVDWEEQKEDHQKEKQ